MHRQQNNTSGGQGTGSAALDKILAGFGFAYEPAQSIFFSIHNAWQREYGYFPLYDEMLAPLSMIVDCEPVYFAYEGKRWLLELWKGQYGLATGCEIGVYYTGKEDIELPGLYSGPFFQSADDSNLLFMSCSLYKTGKKLFSRRDRHWWLTGFILGEFSEPEELSMAAAITLKDRSMRKAFTAGLQNAGYSEEEDFFTDGNTVRLLFSSPRTPQPSTRTEKMRRIMQWTNKLLCAAFNEVTGGLSGIAAKFAALKEQSPELYRQSLLIGKNKQLFEQLNIEPAAN